MSNEASLRSRNLKPCSTRARLAPPSRWARPSLLYKNLASPKPACARKRASCLCLLVPRHKDPKGRAHGTRAERHALCQPRLGILDRLPRLPKVGFRRRAGARVWGRELPFCADSRRSAEGLNGSDRPQYAIKTPPPAPAIGAPLL